MQFEIQTKSRALAGLLRDDENKPEGVSIKLSPSSYERRDITIQETILTFIVVLSGTVSANLISHWLIENIKKHDPDTKITYKQKEIEVSKEGVVRAIEENIEINKTT